MRTDLPAEFLATVDGARADAILRSCVHCGFCNATCPTYALLGDELDGPRGRIYLIKDMLETQQADAVAARHLDRCLTCRACETTCPSGVRYGELLEIGRDYLERQRPRRGLERLQRRWLIAVVPHRRWLRRWLALGRTFRWLLPRRLRSAVPPAPARQRDRAAPPAPVGSTPRRVILLDGCMQAAATPQVNDALRRLLGARGIDAVAAPGEGCCGALALHLGDTAAAHRTMTANVLALYAGAGSAEAILSTASGCGVTVKDYGRLLGDARPPPTPAAAPAGGGEDGPAGEAAPTLAQQAGQVAQRTVDAAEYLASLPGPWARRGDYRRVAWHAPCTLQHGQRIGGLVEGLLEAAGYELVPVAEPHLCCGSAGTYSMLQPELAGQLKSRKLAALQTAGPDVIATANVGCQLHLATAAAVPVRHWLELLA